MEEEERGGGGYSLDGRVLDASGTCQSCAAVQQQAAEEKDEEEENEEKGGAQKQPRDVQNCIVKMIRCAFLGWPGFGCYRLEMEVCF